MNMNQGGYQFHHVIYEKNGRKVRLPVRRVEQRKQLQLDIELVQALGAQYEVKPLLQREARALGVI
jgi:hypothetical protein